MLLFLENNPPQKIPTQKSPTAKQDKIRLADHHLKEYESARTYKRPMLVVSGKFVRIDYKFLSGSIIDMDDELQSKEELIYVYHNIDHGRNPAKMF